MSSSIVLYLHIFFVSIILLSSFFLILSQNPVYSVLSLIVIFFSATSILILFGVDFISLLFIIIYVGAIAVLFLFVVMMLDIKVYNYNNNVYNTHKSAFLYFIFLFLTVNFFYTSDFLSVFDKNFTLSKSFNVLLDSFFGIDVFGQSLYNNYVTCVILAGLILLVAMLGAIVLTLKFKSNRKNQLTLKQLSRTNNFLSYFKSSNKIGN